MELPSIPQSYFFFNNYLNNFLLMTRQETKSYFSYTEDARA